MAATGKAQAQSVVLHNVSWETYERLLAEHENSSAPRFTYDGGELEIMSPLPRHERYNHNITMLVEIVAEENGIDLVALGSTTFRREDLERGFEPDSCFYIANEEAVREKDTIDLRVDPPPDLVIELDITSPSLNKLPIYAHIGVPEVWRYDGERLDILLLEGGRYMASEGSRALPGVTADAVSQLIRESQGSRRTVWLRRVREWARQLDRAG